MKNRSMRHLAVWALTIAMVLSMTSLAYAAIGTAINIPAIDGVSPPVAGQPAVTTITETAQFTGTVSWDLDPVTQGIFWNSTVYTATITLTAKAGYTLNGVAADFFTVAGATSVSNAANSGVVTAVFPETDEKFDGKFIGFNGDDYEFALTVGYTQVYPQAINVINTGDQPVTITDIVLSNDTDFEITLNTHLWTVVPQGGIYDVATIVPKDDLPVGTYTTTVTIESDAVIEISNVISCVVYPISTTTPPASGGSSSTATTDSYSRSSGSSSGTTYTPPRATKTTISAERLGGGAQQTGNYSWRVDLPALGFQSATVGGVELVRGEDYTIRSGSTVLTLTDSYLSTLRPGSYTLNMEFLSATATIDFTVDSTGSSGNSGITGPSQSSEAPALIASNNDNMNPSTGM